MEKISYEKINIEECFTLYHTKNIRCECNGDGKMILTMEE